MRHHAALGAQRIRPTVLARAGATSLLLLVVAGGGPVGALAAASTTVVDGTGDVRGSGETVLATSFTPTMSGSVLGLRYWRPGAGIGPAVGSIRAGDGTLLATVSRLSDSAAAGWQIVTFERPVAVVATHHYAVTVVPATAAGASVHRSSTGRAPTRAAGHWPTDFARSASALAWGGLTASVEVVFTPDAVTVPTPAPDPAGSPAPSPTVTSSAPPARSAVPSPRARTTPAPVPAAPPPPAPGGAGWPTASNTGVPAGTVLKASGPLTVTVPGTVINGLLVDGSITVRANNVTIKNTKVVGGGIDNGDGNVAGTLIQDVEIDGASVSGFLAGISYSGFTVVRANIHHVGVGVHANSDVVMRDSYVHDIVVEGDPANGGSHNEAFLSNGGNNITVTNNRLSSADQPNVSSALSLYGDFSPISNVLVQGNLFNGGGYCVYAGSVPGKPYPVATNTRFVGNTFGREMSPGCGGYGPVIDFTPGGGNVWSGNSWIDGGAVTP